MRATVVPRPSDRGGQSIGHDVDALRRDMQSIPFLDGVELSASLVAGGKDVAHTLKRTPRGWFLTDLDTNTTVWRTAWDSGKITLDCGADCAVRLWLF